jgi:hypothetical protein
MVDLAMKNNMMKTDSCILGCVTALLGMGCHHQHVAASERVKRFIKNAKIHPVARIYRQGLTS